MEDQMAETQTATDIVKRNINTLLAFQQAILARQIKGLSKTEDVDAGFLYWSSTEINDLQRLSLDANAYREISLAKLAAKMGRDEKQVARLFDYSSEGGRKMISIDDVVELAVAFNVPISALLRPTVEELDANVTISLEQKDMRGPVIEFEASEWMAWIYGLAPAPDGWVLQYIERDVLNYDVQVDEIYAKPSPLPSGRSWQDVKAEAERFESATNSPTSAFHEFTQIRERKVPHIELDSRNSSSIQVRMRYLVLLSALIRHTLWVISEGSAEDRDDEISFALEALHEIFDVLAIAEPSTPYAGPDIFEVRDTQL